MQIRAGTSRLNHVGVPLVLPVLEVLVIEAERFNRVEGNTRSIASIWERLRRPGVAFMMAFRLFSVMHAIMSA